MIATLLLLLISIVTEGAKPGFTVVTATSRNHLCAMGNLLASLDAHEKGRRVIVYDLAPWEGKFPKLDILQKINPSVSAVRPFPYADYPPWFNVSLVDLTVWTSHPTSKHHARGQYAWKNVMIKTVHDEFGDVLW